jgi:Tfp pilus assembly protein PilV
VTITPAQSPAAESGFVLIEILVSAVVLVIASAGVITLLQTSVRSQSEGRHSSEAYALAQEDQARLASMRLAALNRLDETRTVSLSGTEFKVRSTGVFVNDATSTASCGEGTSSADYVQITSTVTWPRMTSPEKAKIESVLSPSNGSLDPNNGTIAFSVKNQQQVAVPNVSILGGSGAFSGLTDAAGCGVFTDLPAGDYSTTVSGASLGLVNKDGLASVQETLSVTGGDVKTFNYEFDYPGAIPVNFQYWDPVAAKLVPSTADSIVANNTGMKQARVFGAPAGTRSPAIEAKPLFPFSSAYTVYAGSCASNHPDPEGKNPGAAAAMANVVAPAGGSAQPVTLQLPALELVVKRGSELLKGAKVTITDRVCKDASNNLLKRTYTSNEKGLPSNSSTGLAELGLPWGGYDLCASAFISGGNRREKVSNVTVQSLTSTPTVTIDLGSGYESDKQC